MRFLLPEADMKLQSGGSGPVPKYDGSATREEIGYAPQYEIEEGVKQNINVIRQRARLAPVG